MDHKEAKIENEISELFLSIMEGYSDSVIPPLSSLSPLHEVLIANRNAIDGNNHERVILRSNQREKERRLSMNESYSVLQSMVPNLFPKASKDEILGETIKYIRSLKKEIRTLEAIKNSSPSSSSSSSQNSSINVTAVSGNLVLFGIEMVARKRLVTEIFRVFQTHGIEVLAANVAVDDHGQLRLTVTTTVNGSNKDYLIEKIKRDILVL